MKINKVENSNIKIAFEPNIDFFMGLFLGVLIGSGLIYIF
nr:MAG TPA: YtxH-like protein [Crassvirales sp.]